MHKATNNLVCSHSFNNSVMFQRHFALLPRGSPLFLVFLFYSSYPSTAGLRSVASWVQGEASPLLPSRSFELNSVYSAFYLVLKNICKLCLCVHKSAHFPHRERSVKSHTLFGTPKKSNYQMHTPRAIEPHLGKFFSQNWSHLFVGIFLYLYAFLPKTCVYAPIQCVFLHNIQLCLLFTVLLHYIICWPGSDRGCWLLQSGVS